MFKRNLSVAAPPPNEDWPGLGTWFKDSECCPECRPYLQEQRKTIQAARERALAPEPEARPDPPGLGVWYADSECCPECQPYLEEQAKTIARARHRPSAPQRAIEKARQRARENPSALLPDVEPDAPVMAKFEWDTVDDHEMTAGGKLFWNLAIYGGIAAIPVALLVLSPFTPADTAKHYVAAAGCQFGQLVSMAPARTGEPGYHSHLDPDSDGIACEPQTKRTLSSGGSPFVRVPER